VQVVNTASNPVPTVKTDWPAKNAVGLVLASESGGEAGFESGSLVANASFRDANGTYVVPAGYRLVVDTLSLDVSLPFVSTGIEQLEEVVVQTTTAGNVVNLFVNPQQNASAGGLVYSAAVKLYADPGTSVRLLANRESTVGSGDIRGSVYGHLEPIQ
jgi:hypothetical protein